MALVVLLFGEKEARGLAFLTVLCFVSVGSDDGHDLRRVAVLLGFVIIPSYLHMHI